LNPWLFLTGAIVAEVCATLALRASEGFSRPMPSLVVPLGYGVAFFMLSRCLKAGMSLGVAYAVWASPRRRAESPSPDGSCSMIQLPREWCLALV